MSIRDLIDAAADETPVKFGDVFEALMEDKLSEQLVEMKKEVISNLFGLVAEEKDEDESDDDEGDSDKEDGDESDDDDADEKDED